MPSTSGVLYIRDLPETLKDFYKGACAKKGLTMKQDMLLHMTNTVKAESEIYDAYRKQLQREIQAERKREREAAAIVERRKRPVDPIETAKRRIRKRKRKEREREAAAGKLRD